MTEIADSASPQPRTSRIFYGWWVVLAASAQGTLGNGTANSGFAVFFLPIKRELALSSAAMSLVLSLSRAEGGVTSPVMGWLVDKVGARPLILVGGLLAGLGMMALAGVNAYWQLIVLYVFLISVGKSAGMGQTLMAAVNQWFIRRKALAMSIQMTSSAIGGAIVVPLLALGNAHLGWRATILLAGLSLALFTIPTALVIRSRPEDVGLLPDGPQRPARQTASDGKWKLLRLSRVAPPSSGDYTVRQAMRTSSFWFLLAGTVLRVGVSDAIIIHMIPLLVSRGIGEGQAALLLSLLYLTAIPLRLMAGTMVGFLPARAVLLCGMSLGALGMACMLTLDGMVAALPFVLALAVVEGITAANWITLGDYFGRAHFGSLMGIMSVFHSIGSIVTPVMSGWIYDVTGGYTLVMLIVAPLYLAGGVAFALARRPPALPPAPSAAPNLEQARASL